MNVWKAHILLALICLSGSFASSSSAQAPNVASLFEGLQSPGTSDQSELALQQLGLKDVEVRDDLIRQLPPIIDKGPKGSLSLEVWKNCVRLAGELKIVEAVPALGNWVGIDSVGPETTAGQFQRMETNPAGKALSQIGDPAIPTLVTVLDRGTVRERRNVYMILNIIDSLTARATIRARVGREEDPKLNDLIQRMADAQDSVSLEDVPQDILLQTAAASFAQAYSISGRINPFYLRGDFDGDGKADYAILVVSNKDYTKGIAIWLSSQKKFFVLGAGQSFKFSDSESADLAFIDTWQVYGKKPVDRGVGAGPPPRLIGEALLVGKSESASGLVYWNGKHFAWCQQGD